MTGITVTIIAKNETAFLPECLASVAAVADEIVVADTGSTDSTREIARAAGAIVLEVPWRDDFAWARNRALDAVRTPWVLVLDADERLVADDIPTLLQAAAAPCADAYNIRIVSLADRPEDLSEAQVTRFFRHDPRIRWSGRVHEQIIPSLLQAGLKLGVLNVRLLHYGYLGAVTTSRDKVRRNLALLDRMKRERPQDPYVRWQRAQTLIQAGEPGPAAREAEAAERLLPVRSDLQPLVTVTLAKAYWSAGDLHRANRAIDRGLVHWPRYPDFHFLKGQLAAAGRDFRAAETSFLRAVSCGEQIGFLQTETGVGSFKPLWQLARIMLQEGHGPRATAYLLVLLRVQPYFRPAWQTLLAVLAGTPIEVVAEQILRQMPRETALAALSQISDPGPDEMAFEAYLTALPTTQRASESNGSDGPKGASVA